MAAFHYLLILAIASSLEGLEKIESIENKRTVVMLGQSIQVENDIRIKATDSIFVYHHAIDAKFYPNLIDVLAFDSNGDQIDIVSSSNQGKSNVMPFSVNFIQNSEKMPQIKIYEVYNQRIIPVPEKIRLNVNCLYRKIKKLILLTIMVAFPITRYPIARSFIHSPRQVLSY